MERLHLCGMTVHPPSAKLAKTALGAMDYVPWTYYERTLDAIEALHKQGVPLVAVELLEGAIPYTTFDWPKPVAIILGNEVSGVAREVLEHSDAAVMVPMKGYKNALNIATIFGIVLYEVLRRWQTL